MGYYCLDLSTPCIVSGGGDRNLAQMYWLPGLSEKVCPLPDLVGSLYFLACGDVQALLGIEQVHLGAHNVDLASTRNKIIHLVEIALRHIIVVDVELDIFRERFPGGLESLECIVGRHNPVAALDKSPTRLHLGEVRGTLIDDIPAVDTAPVSAGQILYPLLEQVVNSLGIFWKGI